MSLGRTPSKPKPASKQRAQPKQFSPQTFRYLEEDLLSLQPVSKVRDGLFIGSFEAAASQEVSFNYFPHISIVSLFLSTFIFCPLHLFDLRFPSV
jgi:hypothetical protein